MSAGPTNRVSHVAPLPFPKAPSRAQILADAYLAEFGDIPVAPTLRFVIASRGDTIGTTNDARAAFDIAREYPDALVFDNERDGEAVCECEVES